MVGLCLIHTWLNIRVSTLAVGFGVGQAVRNHSDCSGHWCLSAGAVHVGEVLSGRSVCEMVSTLSMQISCIMY